jgi:hypothetical protein
MNTSLRTSKTIYEKLGISVDCTGYSPTKWCSRKNEQNTLSIATLHVSFWGYALELFKSVSKIPTELWLGHKLSLNHIHIWGCRAHEELPR